MFTFALTHCRYTQWLLATAQMSNDKRAAASNHCKIVSPFSSTLVSSRRMCSRLYGWRTHTRSPQRVAPRLSDLRVITLGKCVEAAQQRTIAPGEL